MATLFIGDDESRPTRVANDRTNTANISGGPKRRPMSASGTMKKVIETVAIRAPRKLERNEDARATPGLPRFLASGKPSKRRATAHGSPGMLNRIEVMT